jgi:predicted ATPase
VSDNGLVKVAFIGTHGVGKTTLCFELAALLKHRGRGVDIVKEVARLSPLPINRQTSIDAQVWILVTQVAEEIRSASHNEVVVCDRSVLDNYAYLVRACGRQPEIERFVDYWLHTYDVLFKVPVVGRAAPDGVRDVDVDFVQGIDALVDELLEEKRVAHQRLDPAARATWAGHAGDVIAERTPQRSAATPVR